MNLPLYLHQTHNQLEFKLMKHPIFYESNSKLRLDTIMWQIKHWLVFNQLNIPLKKEK